MNEHREAWKQAGVKWVECHANGMRTLHGFKLSLPRCPIPSRSPGWAAGAPLKPTFEDEPYMKDVWIPGYS